MQLSLMGCGLPFSKGGRGKLEAARLDDMGAYLVRALMERNPKVKPTMIHDGIGHRPGELGRGLNMVAHLAGLPAEMTDFASERACATSQETAMRISMAIMLGEYDCGISVGVERMGTDQMGGNRPPRNTTRREGSNPKSRQLTK